MRASAYRLFEIVAWPALAWCALEIPLRATTGAMPGSVAAALTGACAAATIVACRWRSHDLQRQAAPIRRD